MREGGDEGTRGGGVTKARRWEAARTGSTQAGSPMDSPYTCLYAQVFLLGGIAGQRALGGEGEDSEQGAEG